MISIVNFNSAQTILTSETGNNTDLEYWKYSVLCNLFSDSREDQQ